MGITHSEKNQTNENQEDEEDSNNPGEYSFYKKLEKTLREQAIQKKKKLSEPNNNIKIKTDKKFFSFIGRVGAGVDGNYNTD